MAGDRSRELRRFAAECLALAQRISDLRVRVYLLEIAQKRIDLAELGEHDTLNEALRLRAIQAVIGEQLRVEYELPRELPHSILTLLMQLNGQNSPG
jgi:hypothetical protein